MPTVLNYPGVYIEELPSAVRTITGVPTSIAAFVGRAWKGPVDQPVTVNSLADYERTFGGLWVGSSMSYAIAQFFANGGGQAIVVRVVNRPGRRGHGRDHDEVRGQWRDEAGGAPSRHLGQQPQPDRRHDRQPGPAGGPRPLPSDRPRFARSEGGFGQARRERGAGVVPERVDHADQPALPPSRPGRAVEAHPRPGRPGGQRRRVGTGRERRRSPTRPPAPVATAATSSRTT